MSASKHDKAKGSNPFPDDFGHNPGIGQSKGSFATGEDPLSDEGGSTVEGDVENQADSLGRANAYKLGRTNK